MTLLCIASRYYKIVGSGGESRSHAIHEELWRYLRRMIERCLWGQEAFGGGFCGSGADESQTSSTAPWRGMRKGSLRTLGTIESMMIMTEWHPRALHFPPDEATDELMLPSYEGHDHVSADEDDNTRMGGNVGGRRIESWLEPAWRSDRMCWMLLSTAMGLAYELGVFDNIEDALAHNSITRPEYEDEAYRLRATRIKRLLLVYSTQLAGRLGWTNMVPESIRRTDPALSHAHHRQRSSNEGTTPGTSTSVISNTFNYVPDVELDDQVINCWVGVSNAMHLGNEKLFSSRQFTTRIIQSGQYTTLLKEFQPILSDWKTKFEKIRLPMFIRHILTIEYEYVRIYVNSLALQAVVERSTNNNNISSGGNAHGDDSSSNPHQLSPQTLGNLPLSHVGGFSTEDHEYVKEVVDGCRNLLRTVVDGLLPGGYLKHAPVRTYFRIISGAMFLLKTFAIGAPKSDVEISVGLMDRTVEALRTCVVDDVHLGTRFSDLLESLTFRLRSRFKHVTTNAASADMRDARPGPAHSEGKAGHANGHSHSYGPENGASTHTSKFRDGLGVPGESAVTRLPDGTSPDRADNLLSDRSSTPSLPISATPFDMSAGHFPFASGPSSIFRSSTPGPSVTNAMETSHLADHAFETDWAEPGEQFWYLPTGPGLYQNQNTGENSNVTMTDQGVNVGGLDLLEYMAMDPMPFTHNMDGTGGF